ncbi:MAG: LysM peptidoglycan-binding domain-containing protein [Pseudomonadota bacterium]
MIKGFLPILYASAGLSAAALLGYIVFGPELFTGSQKDQTVQITPSENKTEIAKLVPETESSEPTATDTTQAPETEPVAPVFSLLRVEKDGSLVVAGSGPGNSTVVLLEGEVQIGTAESGPEGDFVFVLDKPLSPGSHELSLRATPRDGEPILSAEAGLINVPEPESGEEPTVIVAEAGKASRILQKPTTDSADTETEIAAATPEQEASPVPESTETEPTDESQTAEAVTSDDSVTNEESQTPENQSAQAEVNTTQETVEVEAKEQVELAKAETSDEPIQTEPAKPVLIEAADIEKGRVFIAGTGEAGGRVNIYLDSKFLGSTEIGSNGAFLYEGNHDIATGRYDIRADMTKGSSPKVLARAEVLLIHDAEPETEIASAEPEKADEPVAPSVAQDQTSLTAQVESTSEAAAATTSSEGTALKDPTAENPSDTTQTAEATEVETEIAATQPATSQAVQPEPQVAQEVEAVEEAGSADVETAAASEPEKKEIRTGSAVIIRRGDNLWRIARRNYGDGIRYTTIFEANRDQIRDPDLIYPGQVFKVPEDDAASGETSDG